MRDDIINHLIVKIMKEKTFDVHYAKRARVAWILAEKQYLNLTEDEKQKIIKELSKSQQ
jgi:hypothetical protein